MPSLNAADHQGDRLTKQIVGRVINTVGVVFVSICLAMTASVYEDISAVQRTIGGLLVAATMIVAGQLIAGRRQAGSQSTWFGTTLMSTGYGLAYFFIYATHYVRGLSILADPYACWVLGPALGAIGTYHGTKNRTMRWFSVFFTLLVTGHALFQVLTSPAVVSLAGFEMKVAVIGCLASVLWCGALSAVYKRLEQQFRWEGAADNEERASWLMHRVAHEVYFVGAALSAMAVPVVQGSLETAPLWWSLLAPVLLAVTYRSANFIKHGAVAVIWLAAAVSLIAQGGTSGVANLVAVPLAGVLMSVTYRFLRTGWEQKLKVSGYCVYMYGAVAVSLLVPYLHFGVLGAMPYWLIGALVLAALGMALRDGLVHDAGWLSGLVGLALFAYQFDTWTWGLVTPVVVCAYALSVTYSYFGRRGGCAQSEFLTQAEFLPELLRRPSAVSAFVAERLEHLWSWVGCATILASSLVLVDHQTTVFWWALEGLALVTLGFTAMRLGYRAQGLAAFALASGKLLFWDVTGGQMQWNPDVAFTLFNAGKFGAVGLCMLLASFLYFREEAQYEAALAASNNPEGGDGNQPPAGEGNDTGNRG